MPTKQLIAATLETIGRPKQSKYEGKPDYRPCLFKLPNGETRWKSYNVDAPELEWLKRGNVYQAIIAGDDFNIIQPDTATPSAVPATQPSSAAPTSSTTLLPEQKKAIAEYVSGQADLLAYCWQVAEAKLPSKSEESHRCAASTLYIAAQRKFSL